MPLSDAVRRFLAEPRFAVLATIGADSVPRQTVMWYELRGDTIVMNTAAGRLKDTLLRRDPRASVCVEDGYRYVTIAGTIQIVDDPATAQEDIRRLAVRYHGEEDGNRQARESFSTQQRMSLYLPIERVLARDFDES
jgi:PPOX class probable F420-dependent enzyme